jgi:hypothetical protein
MQVGAWLARLANKLDAAQTLEAELKPPCSTNNNNSSRRRLPLCKDCLRAAEVARKAAQSVGLQGLKAAPAAQLAQGYGRAVCWLLQGMADVVRGQLQLACKRPSYNNAAARDGEALCEELQQDDAEDEADVAAAAAAIAAAAADSSEESDDTGFAEVAGNLQQERQRGSPAGRHAGSAALGHAAVIRTQVWIGQTYLQLEALRIAVHACMFRAICCICMCNCSGLF